MIWSQSETGVNGINEPLESSPCGRFVLFWGHFVSLWLFGVSLYSFCVCFWSFCVSLWASLCIKQLFAGLYLRGPFSNRRPTAYRTSDLTRMHECGHWHSITHLFFISDHRWGSPAGRRPESPGRVTFTASLTPNNMSDTVRLRLLTGSKTGSKTRSGTEPGPGAEKTTFSSKPKHETNSFFICNNVNMMLHCSE